MGSERERCQNVDRAKKPLLTSKEWVTIQVDRQMGRNAWNEIESTSMAAFRGIRTLNHSATTGA